METPHLPPNEQIAILERGMVISSYGELKSKMTRPLRVKFGIDPTAARVHLGHAVALLKLRQFQNLGHKIILILGDFTACIGDPTGRDETRPKLSEEEIRQNAKEYLRQIGKIIDVKKSEVMLNSHWFNAWTTSCFINFMRSFTVQQMLERNDFNNRLKSGTPVYFHECVYPMLQAYDSAIVAADVELGGTEQLFNLMLARDVQRDQGQEPQVCCTVPILRGLDGVKRMGKSLNNYIALEEEPNEMYAKVMSIPDSLLEEWWKLLPVDDLAFPSEDNMRTKKLLAHRLVCFFHKEEAAIAAGDAWHNRFTLKKDPDDIPEVKMALNEEKVWICKLLVSAGLAKSNNEARRLIAPNWPKPGNSGVTVGPDRKKIEDPAETLYVHDGLILRVGSRRIVRVKVEQ